MYEPGSALMRLFKSDLFSPFIAIKYLFSSDDRDNRVYLGFIIPPYLSTYLFSRS